MSRDAAVTAARAVADSVIWCVLATVGPDGTPRTRIVHPVWDWDEGVGWIASRPTPLRRRHLAAQPSVSCAYWSIEHEAYLDCRATWVPEAGKQAVWDRCSTAPPPLGFDPGPMFPGGASGDGFAPILLEPFRIRVGTAADMAAGRFPEWWTA